MIFAVGDILGKGGLVTSYVNPDYMIIMGILVLGSILTGGFPIIRSVYSEFSLNRVFILSLFFLWPELMIFEAAMVSLLIGSLLRRINSGTGFWYYLISGTSVSAILLTGSLLPPGLILGLPSQLATVALIPVVVFSDIISVILLALLGKEKSHILDKVGKQLIFYIAVLPLTLITVILVLQADILGAVIAVAGISGFSFIGRSIEKNHRFNQTRIRAISHQDRLATELMKSSSYSEFVMILEHHFFDSHTDRIRIMSRSSGLYDWTIWSISDQLNLNSEDIEGDIPAKGELMHGFRVGETAGMAVGLSEESDLVLLVGGNTENIVSGMPTHLLDNLILLLRHTWEAVGHSMRSEHSFLAAAVMLARLADSKDDYTHGHSVRVSNMSTALGRDLGLSSDSISTLRVGGILHDIGKLAIPNEILTKRGLLTKKERKIIQNHPIEGARIVSELSGYEQVTRIIRSHHERLDGSGYPDGLSGIDIPFLARIVAVADTFDAITSARSYHSITGWDNAMETIMKGRGIQFDSRIVDALESIIREGAVNWA